MSLGGRTPGPGHCVTTVTVGPCGSRSTAVIGFLSAGAFPLEAREARGVNWSRSSYSLGGKGEKNPSYTPITGKMTQCVVTYPCCGIAHRRGLVSTGASRINKDQAQNRTLSQKHTHRTCIREERACRTLEYSLVMPRILSAEETSDVGRMKPRKDGRTSYWPPEHWLAFPLFLPWSSHSQDCSLLPPYSSWLLCLF